MSDIPAYVHVTQKKILSEDGNQKVNNQNGTNCKKTEENIVQIHSV